MKKKDIITAEAETVEENNDKVNIRKSVNILKLLPSAVTIAAFCFGLTAVRFALFQKWELAVICIFISALLDAFDGKVARLLGQSSQFGAELDSLSDLVCFGVAPSIILFLSTMYRFNGIGWAACMFFTVCCAMRLARFNATQIANVPQPDWAKKYFTGVPAPAGAILALFPLILFFATDKTCFLNVWFVAFCLLASGALMISTLKTFSSKMVEINSNSALLSLLVISFLVICLITELWLTLSILVFAYLISIPFGPCEYAKLQKREAASEEEK
ncbi:MAG: CDP-diacylglycerol--serine O-phosphatidyltransferase [Alphaproteobacteria bacterium]|nr:CDP-diacylglycerol--serine O-phosphatidyltransferase [Alphaproteobacteria bacterium]